MQQGMYQHSHNKLLDHMHKIMCVFFVWTEGQKFQKNITQKHKMQPILYQI